MVKLKKRTEQGGDPVKEQLGKKVRQLCENMGTASAEAKADELAAEVEAEYERRVASGMAQIDAYKAVLANIDKIEALLRELPETEAEQAERRERMSRKEWNKKLSAVQGRLQSLWWLLTVIFYFWYSFTFGDWHLSWLTFLSSSIGSIIIDMLFDYNKGVPKKKVFGRLHGILWLAVVIAYFLISFASGDWHITWLIFIFGAVIESIVGVIGKIIE